MDCACRSDESYDRDCDSTADLLWQWHTPVKPEALITVNSTERQMQVTIARVFPNGLPMTVMAKVQEYVCGYSTRMSSRQGEHVQSHLMAQVVENFL